MRAQDYFSHRQSAQEHTSSFQGTRQTNMGGSNATNFSAELQEVHAGMELLKRLLDEESSARKAGDALSGEACLQLQAQMRDLAEGGLNHDENRAAGSHESERKVRDLRQALEVEAKERRASDDDILQRIGELFVRLEQESGNRELADTNMRSQMGTWREELAMERASRGDEEVRMRCNFQKTEVSLTEKINEILREREGTNLQLNQFKHRINELSSNLDVELEKRIGEVKMSLERCERNVSSRDLIMPKQEPSKDMFSECLLHIQELSTRLDGEARERAGGEEILMARVRDLAAAIKQEKDERQLWHEHAADRVLGDNDVVAERHARTEENATLRRDLEREIAAVRGKTAEIQASLTSVAAAAAAASAAAASVQEPKFVEERAPKPDERISVEAIKSVSEQLEIECRERRSDAEVTARRIQELSTGLRKEKGEREAGDSSTRTQVVSCLRELVGEKEKRVDEQSSLRRVFQNLEEHVGQQLSDLRLTIESEVSMQADGKSMRSNGMTFEDNAMTFRQEINNEIRNLRSSVQEELTKHVQTAQPNLNGDDMRREREERQMEDRLLHQLLGNLTEQINGILDEARTSWEGESQLLWEALHTHTHDVHLNHPDGRPMATGSMGPTSSVFSKTPLSTPAPANSPPPAFGSMRAGSGVPKHNPSLGSRGNNLGSSPRLPGRESFADRKSVV